MYILGLSFYYHDSAACLVKDGKIVAAAEEERFTRKKHDPAFPKEAISFCLAQENIDISDIDYVVFYEKPFLKFERILFSHFKSWPKGYLAFYRMLNLWLTKKLRIKKTIKKELDYKGKIFFVKHHESHAASSFFCSGFKEAAVVTVDGVGEWATTTISEGIENNISPREEVHFPHSLGLLYSAFTQFLGFEVNDGEYKVMGLAPYGRPVYEDLIKKDIVTVFPDGGFTLNMRYFQFEYGDEMIHVSRFEKLFGFKKRNPGEGMDQKHKDIAASIQNVCEDILLGLCKEAKRITGQDNLCLAGGVALNCVADAKIFKSGLFKDVFVFPAAGDSGGAVGAALFVWHQVLGNNIRRERIKDVYWGPSFSNEYIEDYLKSIQVPYEKLSKEDLAKRAAELLNEQKIIGWFQGRMEFGPRALGNRSILGDPTNREHWAKINKMIKFREDFRPFAPAVLKEKFNDFFEFPVKESPFMSFVADNKTKSIPAVTHLDGTSRVQTVSWEDNPLFHAVIEEFYRLTGTPAVINTSFNFSGSPIVCTPQNAYQCFLATGLDAVFMGCCLVRREDIIFAHYKDQL